MRAQDQQPASMSRSQPRRTPAQSADPAPMPLHPAMPLIPQAILHLQRTIGNAAVARLIEAQRQQPHSRGDSGEHSQPGPRSTVHDVLRAPGRPLDDDTRTEMEARLGADFSNVRLHTDTFAQASAAELGARAFTSGNHVVIGADGSHKHTLAHELTHVIQQRQGPVAGTDHGGGLSVSNPSDRFEQAAEANARRVMSGPVPASAEIDDAQRTLKHDHHHHDDVAVQRMGNCFSDESQQNQGTELTRTSRSNQRSSQGQRRRGGQGQQPQGQSSQAEASGTQGGAPPPQAAVQVLVPNVLDVLNQFGIPLRELEMRMLDPQGVIMGIVYGDPIPALEGMNLAQVYQWLTANFTSACGDTANLLRETTFPDSGAERSLRNLTEVVAELRRPEDANIRINSLGHAFFVERRGGSCRILQSYFGRYALADSAGGAAHAGATAMPAAQLADRLQAVGDHHLANQRESRPFSMHADEEALFGGPLFAASDIRDDGVNLRGEVVTNVQPENEQHDRANAQLARFAGTWDEIRTSTLTPAEWLETQF